MHRHETLHACASISVAKLCNFPLPYLVYSMEKKIIFCFSPKYLGIPDLTKYVVKKNSLCPEEGLHFHYFNQTLGHFYTFNKIHKKPFPKVVDMVNLTPISIRPQQQQLRAGAVKKLPFSHKKVDKISSFPLQ